MRRSPDSKEILSAIRSVAHELGRAPTRAEFTRRSGISHFKVLARFPSLREAIRQAGLKPNPQGLRISSPALLNDWGQVARKLRCLPSRSQYLRHGRFSAGVFTLRFGSWTAVPQSFIRFAREAGREEEWKDVLATITKSNVEDDRRRDAALPRLTPAPALAYVETTNDAPHLQRRRGDATSLRLPFSSPIGTANKTASLPPPLVAQRCVTHLVLTWIVNTLAPHEPACLADHSYSDRETDAPYLQLPNYQITQLPNSRQLPILRDRRILGSPLSLPGLAYEPVNETGVVFLFGILAHRLGFRVESLQAGFPDCEAIRQFQPGKWQRVRIEFEYESRNFLTHRHPVEDCDVIVCWRHNWMDCPETLDVVELRKIVRRS